MNNQYSALPRILENLVHPRCHFRDPSRGAFAPVFVPHVANDNRRLLRVPLDYPFRDFEFVGAAGAKLARSGVKLKELTLALSETGFENQTRRQGEANQEFHVLRIGGTGVRLWNNTRPACRHAGLTIDCGRK